MKSFQEAAEKTTQEYYRFFDYIDRTQPKLAPRTGNLGKQDCFALNQELGILQENYQKASRTQEYYAVIDFFHFFSIRTEILRTVKKKGMGLVLEKTEKFQDFQQMTAMEKYLMMLTICLGDYLNAEGMDRHSLFTSEILSLLDMDRQRKQSENDEFSWGIAYISQLRLFALFGFLTIEWLKDGREDQNNKFGIKNVIPTETGISWVRLMKKRDKFFVHIYNVSRAWEYVSLLAGKNSKQMEERLNQFFEKTLGTERGTTTIELKVRLDSCIRSIRIGDQDSLYDLHMLIQKSVDFDMDHLYYFQVGSGKLARRFFAPECEDEAWTADAVALAELSLYEGMKFYYMFDFGDNWLFEITVQKIVPGHMDRGEIIGGRGEAPEQYPDCCF